MSRIGLALKIRDGEMLTVAVIKASLGFTNETRWRRNAARPWGGTAFSGIWIRHHWRTQWKDWNILNSATWWTRSRSRTS